MKNKKLILLIIVVLLFFPVNYKRRQDNYSTISDNGCVSYFNRIASLSTVVTFRENDSCGTFPKFEMDTFSVRFGFVAFSEDVYKYPHIFFTINFHEGWNSWMLKFRWFYNEDFTPFVGLKYRLNIDTDFMMFDGADFINNVFFSYRCPEHVEWSGLTSVSCEVELIFDFPNLTTRWYDEDDNLHTKTW